MDPDRPRKDIRTHSGAVAPNVVDLGQEEQRQFEPPNGAMPKWPGHRLSLPLDTEPRRQPPGAATNVAGPGTDRRRRGVANSTYPGLGVGMRMPTYFNFRKTPGLKSLDGQLPPVGPSLSRIYLGLSRQETMTRTTRLDCRPEAMCRIRSGLPEPCLLTL